MSTYNHISPDNKRYIEADLYEFIESLMRTTTTTYKSDLPDLIRNEVVKEQLRAFRSCVGKRK